MTKAQRVVVSNSSPLIYLAKVARLELIRGLYRRIWIPSAVYDEAVSRGKALQIPDASIIERAVGDWIIKEEIEAEADSAYSFLDQNERMGRGEKEALKLCRQLNASFFIVDDMEARRAAKILKIRPIGTCGVLVQAYRRRLVTATEAEEILHSLVRAQFRTSPSLYRRILHEIGLLQ
ncbi:MAG: DUF3368 domain-containing protein [Candidatus Bathyarchaeia archaeon]